MHLLKVALGTGIFAMPNAFHHAGYIVGTIATIILGSIATYCVHILVDLHYELCKWKKVPSMNYPLVAEAALQAGPRKLRRFAPAAAYVIHLQFRYRYHLIRKDFFDTKRLFFNL